MTSKGASWRQKNCHGIKKCVKTSKLLQDVKKYVMMSKSSSWHALWHVMISNIRQRVRHDIQEHFMTSKSWSWLFCDVMTNFFQKFILTSKSTSWRQIMMWKSLSWRVFFQKVCHNIKKYLMTSWRQKVRHDVQTFVMACFVTCHDLQNTSKSLSWHTTRQFGRPRSPANRFRS